MGDEEGIRDFRTCQAVRLAVPPAFLGEWRITRMSVISPGDDVFT